MKYPPEQFLALPDFVWVEIQSSAVEVDRGLEVLGIPESPGRFLQPLDRGVHGLQGGVGDAVAEVGSDNRP